MWDNVYDALQTRCIWPLPGQRPPPPPPSSSRHAPGGRSSDAVIGTLHAEVCNTRPAVGDHRCHHNIGGPDERVHIIAQHAGKSPRAVHTRLLPCPGTVPPATHLPMRVHCMYALQPSPRPSQRPNRKFQSAESLEAGVWPSSASSPAFLHPSAPQGSTGPLPLQPPGVFDRRHPCTSGLFVPAYAVTLFLLMTIRRTAPEAQQRNTRCECLCPMAESHMRRCILDCHLFHSRRASLHPLS